ncbi:MAG: hypothetical protein JWM67_1911 [Mycobacterium sp.]|jgi:hypothetical protein|nr:hypothetical protein [Mycobacterium sp.]
MTDDAVRRDDGTDGGDPACWLARVCPACGRIPDDESAGACGSCGEPLSPRA